MRLRLAVQGVTDPRGAAVVGLKAVRRALEKDQVG